MLVFYAILCAMGLRFFDELLIRQADNPYLLGILAASSGHIVAWPRGDIANMTMNILASFLAGVVLGWVGRLFCGAGLTYARTDHLNIRKERGFVFSNP
jgi:hypothetical protein